MKPVIGLTCSTASESDSKSVRRYSCPEPYVRRVEEAGGIPILLPVTGPDRVAELLALVDGIVLIGGDDVDPSFYGEKPHPKLGPVDPLRDEFEIEVARLAADRALPTFGICRGCQVMNVALGGTLIQDIPSEVTGSVLHSGRYDSAHDTAVTPGTRLHKILGQATVDVNSHHHQSVGRSADGFDVSARASDGVIEAAELSNHVFYLGVQWHPERMPKADATRRLFRAFLEAAAIHTRARSSKGKAAKAAKALKPAKAPGRPASPRV